MCRISVPIHRAWCLSQQRNNVDPQNTTRNHMVSKPPDFLKIHHPTNIDLDQHLELEDFKRSQSAKRNLMAGDLEWLRSSWNRCSRGWHHRLGCPAWAAAADGGGPLHAELKKPAGTWEIMAIHLYINMKIKNKKNNHRHYNHDNKRDQWQQKIIVIYSD